MPAYSDLDQDTIYLSPEIRTGELEHILLHEVGHLVDKNLMDDEQRTDFCLLQELDCSRWTEPTYAYSVSKDDRAAWGSSPAEVFAEGYAAHVETRSSQTSSVADESSWYDRLNLAD